jgi:hypothetical protein
MIYACCDERRRLAIEGSPLNGIDYLEVLDRDAPTPADRQRTLLVRFVNAPAPALSPVNLQLDGGERIVGIRVTGCAVDANDSHVLRVAVDQPGDYSRYTLRLIQAADNPDPPQGIDPVLAAVDFSFKAECPSGFDCRGVCRCQAAADVGPEIDYLAKDYSSFRRLILDRMSTLAPSWRERSPADLGVALVELFAYVGDYLSYQQDAVATEAYLGTARRRVSVRRHARLVDYAMHDGCNARTWIHLQVDADATPNAVTPTWLPTGTVFCTGRAESGRPLANAKALAEADAVFETMEPLDGLYVAHNRLSFYTWGDRECCLPMGATSATLAGHLPNLPVGAVLIAEEVLGPVTGDPADADPEHRQALRLSTVRAFDPGGAPLADPLTGTQITEITWQADDALAFPLCISSRTNRWHGEQYIADVSVALGNVVLADHGQTLSGISLGAVPRPPTPRQVLADRCAPGDPVAPAPLFRPWLPRSPVSQCATFQAGTAAARCLTQDPAACLPAVHLDSTLGNEVLRWDPRLDLLNDESFDTGFVVEIEVDGSAGLRFGDGTHGRRPKADTPFEATLRVGNGVPGNVGREAIGRIDSSAPVALAITAVRNPLPASGGIEPETIDDVRQRAPSAFWAVKKRAVTEPDYAEAAERYPGIQRAASTFRWTGSWHTVFLTVDRTRGRDVDQDFAVAVERAVEPYRMAGSDLDVDRPRPVSLEIELNICVAPDHVRSDVKSALLQVFGRGLQPNGQPGFFNPDQFTFGQAVYLSPIIAAAQSVDGVQSVDVAIFRRQGAVDPAPLREGRLELDRLEIARLDNDPNFPEHGVLRLNMAGGM